MEISKLIPARKKTLHARWCKADFLVMTPEYRAIRESMGGGMVSCYWCKHKFEYGEMMALACFEEAGNKTLCQKCAAELLSSARCCHCSKFTQQDLCPIRPNQPRENCNGFHQGTEPLTDEEMASMDLCSELVALGDVFGPQECSKCGALGYFGVASQGGPDGCREAVKAGRVFCGDCIPPGCQAGGSIASFLQARKARE
jgi:hypothetical protein